MDYSGFTDEDRKSREQIIGFPAYCTEWLSNDSLIIGGGGGTAGTGVPSGAIYYTVVDREGKSQDYDLIAQGMLKTADQIISSAARHPSFPLLALACQDSTYLVSVPQGGGKAFEQLGIVHTSHNDDPEDAFTEVVRFNARGSLLVTGAWNREVHVFSVTRKRSSGEQKGATIDLHDFGQLALPGDPDPDVERRKNAESRSVVDVDVMVEDCADAGEKQSRDCWVAAVEQGAMFAHMSRISLGWRKESDEPLEPAHYQRLTYRHAGSDLDCVFDAVRFASGVSRVLPEASGKDASPPILDAFQEPEAARCMVACVHEVGSRKSKPAYLVKFVRSEGKQQWEVGQSGVLVSKVPVCAMAVSPDHRYVTMTDLKGVLHLFSLKTLERLNVKQTIHDLPVKALSFAPDRRTVFSCGFDQSFGFHPVESRSVNSYLLWLVLTVFVVAVAVLMSKYELSFF